MKSSLLLPRHLLIFSVLSLVHVQLFLSTHFGGLQKGPSALSNTSKSRSGSKSHDGNNDDYFVAQEALRQQFTTQRHASVVNSNEDSRDPQGRWKDPELRNAQQCDRDYGQALDFTPDYPTKESCPNLPHMALAFGKRAEQAAAVLAFGLLDPSARLAADKNTTTTATTRRSGDHTPHTNEHMPDTTFHVKDCSFKWFHPEEACDLVESAGVLYLEGDSLIRQLLVGLGAVLDGNFRSGGISRFTPREHLEACQCEKSWQCWKEPVAHRFTPQEPQFALCPNWKRNHVLTGSLDDYLKQQQENAIGSTPQLPIVAIANGAALHHNLKFSSREVQSHLEDLYNTTKSTGGTLIPMTVHWPGPNKPSMYKVAQGAARVHAYNEALRAWSMQHGDDNNNNGVGDVWPLETYDFTRGLWSRDGVHYDDDNIVLAQLLLNHIWYLQLHHVIPFVERTREEQENDPFAFRMGKPEDVGVGTNTGKIPRPNYSANLLTN